MRFYEQLTQAEKQAARAFRRLFAHRTAEWIKARDTWDDSDWHDAWDTRADDTAKFIGERFGMASHLLLEVVSIIETLEGSLKHRE